MNSLVTKPPRPPVARKKKSIAMPPIPQMSPSTPPPTQRIQSTSPVNDKAAKRLRKSTEDSALQTQVKLEPIENLSQWANTQIKEEPTVSSEMNKQEIPPPPSVIVQPQITSMETDQIPSSSSIATSIHSPSTTSTETENAIKALCSTIQIPQQTISKTSNLEKSSPIIAPISKETLPIVEHQPTSITTNSLLPSHVSMKSSLTTATFSMFILFNNSDFCLSFFSSL